MMKRVLGLATGEEDIILVMSKKTEEEIFEKQDFFDKA